MDTLAQGIPVPVTEDFTIFQIVYESSYQSQGFGANKYARSNAEMDAETAIMHGIEAKVEPFENPVPLQDKIYYQKGYKVLAKTTETGWDIINRKKSMSIKDYVESCRKKSINPRVMIPWLPYDYDI